MEWSDKQLAVFDFIVNVPYGNAVIEAVAGSGKTTTIVEGLKRLLAARPHTNTLFLAFGSAIAKELKNRGVNARTFHSLTFKPVTDLVGSTEIFENKTFALMDAMLTEKEKKIYGGFINRLISLAKQAGVGCLIENEFSVWENLVEHYDLDIQSNSGKIATGVDLARDVFEIDIEGTAANFDDLLYLAVKEDLKLPQYDFVFVDEAQDTNAIQRAILRKVLSPGGRLIAVGDPHQAIYGFRGSDSDSLDLIKQEFKCISLPLNVSYRCPKNVIKLAHDYISHIEASEQADDGVVKKLKHDWKVELIKPFDFIVCRTTKDLIQLAYEMIGKKATVPNVLGRDIAQNLKSLINKMQARTLDGLTDKLDAWHKREVNKARKNNNAAKIESINDRYMTVMFLIEYVGENKRTIKGILEYIDHLFSNKANAATLCTIHKAKGLEADRVFWLNSSLCPAPWARTDWQQQQEINLCYVAVTRAKKELYLIEQ